MCAESDSGLLQGTPAGGPGLQQVLLQRCRWRLGGVGLGERTVEATVAQSARLQGKPLGQGLREALELVWALLLVLELFEGQN